MQNDEGKKKKEGWLVVNDLVAELLKDVFFHIDKISMIHEGFKQETKMKEDANGLMDAVHDSDCDMVLTGFSHRHSSFQIIQLSVAKQHKSGYCGHYALHNALLARKMCQASGTDEIQELMKMLKSTSAYWWRYWLSLRQLMNCVTCDSWWPWTEDHIVTGDMERSFLHYLLEQHHHPSTFSSPPIFVMQYAYGYMQDSVTHIQRLHEAIVSFRESDGSSHLIFILGITNHWASALITKETKNQRQSISVVYFDSCNVPVVTYTDEDILEHMKKREEEKIKKKGKGWTEWEHKITKQSYIDQREVLHMLADCAAGSSDLCIEMVNREVDKITKDFKSSVVDQWKQLGGNKDDLLPLLLNWTQSYTPNSIHGSLVKLLCTFGNKCMSQHSRKALNEWIEFIDVNKFMQTDFTQLLSLYSAVDIVKSYLNN